MKTLALLTALALGSASVGGATQPDEGLPAPAMAEPAVDTSELGDLGMLITPKVIDATAPVLTEAGLDPTQASIRITFLDAENFEYAIRVTLDPSKDLTTAPVLKTCRGCMTDQLVEASVEAVRKAIARKKARDPKMPEPTEDPEPTTPEPTPAEPVDTQPRRGLSPLGWGGVGALAVGVASVATGAAFLGIGETRPETDKSQIRDFRPSGYGLVGVGGALVITGVALIVVDRVRAKKSGRAAAVRPVLAPQHAGIAVTGRF